VTDAKYHGHCLFPEPRTTNFQRCVFISRVIVRCGGDQFGTYRLRVFLGPSSIPVIGDYLSFSITCDIAALSLSQVVGAVAAVVAAEVDMEGGAGGGGCWRQRRRLGFSGGG
jgi:hypothetical protein